MYPDAARCSVCDKPVGLQFWLNWKTMHHVIDFYGYINSY